MDFAQIRQARGSIWRLLQIVMLLVAFPMLADGRPQAACCRPFTPEELAPLRRQLEQEGFPRTYLDGAFDGPGLYKIKAVIGLNAINQESEEIYQKFLKPDALDLARDFWNRHATLLEQIEQRFKIPQEILVAILLVESKFGETGKSYRVLNVYTSLVVASGAASVERFYRRLKSKYPALTRKYLASRLERKAKWAYEELSALLSIGLNYGQDISGFMGSYAGAFGIPQFLPSSYHRWAVDGNGDGQISLFDLADSLASIATYLEQHGWNEAARQEDKQRAVWNYNHSTQYVKIIFAISNAMAGSLGEYVETSYQ